ncbi:MAG: hypothetical protein ACPGOT_06635 [Candidatus Poseidoniaceae archaeon]
MSRTWLTVDTDDAHHRPWQQGHPTRSKDPDGLSTARQPSTTWLSSLRRFGAWVKRTGHPVTVFVIEDQLHHPDSRDALLNLAEACGELLTFGSHGSSHRAWGAWPEDPEGLVMAVKASLEANAAAFGDQAKPWFRAPSGYVAPWMALPLAKAGIVLDSSINPSRLVRRKAGPARRWTDVAHAMDEAGVVERPWHVHRGWPTCGPALHLPGLAGRARRAWRNLPPLLSVEEVEAVTMQDEDVTTVYWHVTDHARRRGNWEPPLRAT